MKRNMIVSPTAVTTLWILMLCACLSGMVLTGVSRIEANAARSHAQANFQYDIEITAVEVTSLNPADQESVVRVTFANRGAQNLVVGEYTVELFVQENLSGGLGRTRCAASAGNPAPTQGPNNLPAIPAGGTSTADIRFLFRQAGNLTLVAKARIGSEDGPTINNTRTRAVTVSLPRPLVCEVTPLTTNPGDSVTIRGNWFRRLGSTDTPTVNIGGVNATVLNVASPVEMTVSMPDLRCTASGRVSVTVTNATGATTFQNGPTFAAAMDITGINPALPCPSAQITINITGLRAGCPNPTARLGTVPLPLVNTTANTIVVQLPPAVPAGPTPLTVQTTYGSDSINLSFPAPTITGTALDTSPQGAAANLTINVANFRPNCDFDVLLEPRVIGGQPLAPGGIVTIPPNGIINTTASSIVVRISISNFIAQYTIRVHTDYGDATRLLTIGEAGPGSELPDAIALPTPPPQITNIVPNPVRLGDTLAIAVNNVPNRPDFNVTVEIPGNQLQVLNRQTNRLVVRVPPGSAPLGNLRLRVTTPKGSDEHPITIVPLPPRITNVSPQPVRLGSQLVILLENVPVRADLPVTVKLGNTTLNCLSRQDNRLLVQIPASFTIGSQMLKVITNGGNDERAIILLF